MRKYHDYHLLVDAVCDLSQEFIDENSDVLTILPTPILKGDGSTIKQITADDFYELQDSDEGAGLSTACASPAETEQAIREIAKLGRNVIYLTLTSSLSSTYEHGVMVCETVRLDFPTQYIVCLDSGCIAGGYGLLIKGILESCVNFDKVMTYVLHYSDRIKHLFTISEFETVVRGGRLKPFYAFAANVLNLRPFMRFDYNSKDEKELLTDHKVRGDKKLYIEMANEVAEQADFSEVVIVAYGNCPERAEAMVEAIKAKAPEAKILCGHDWRVGPTVGVHVGKTVLAVFYLKKSNL